MFEKGQESESLIVVRIGEADIFQLNNHVGTEQQSDENMNTQLDDIEVRCSDSGDESTYKGGQLRLDNKL